MMTNVQKAYDAVYRDGKGGASFNMVFRSLGMISPKFKTKNALRGITWFTGRRYQIRDYDGQRLLQEPIDTFTLFIGAKQPKQRVFRVYRFVPDGYKGIPSVEEASYNEWFGNY